MKNRILMRIDFQNDFVHPRGCLSVNAPELIKKHERFTDNLQSDMFEYIIDSYDTHFPQNYNETLESKSFPLHCVYQSWGWNSAAPFKDNIKVVPIFKSTTNIWNEKKTYEVLAQDFSDKEVYLCGVLSDICVAQALNGLLKRGAKVVILEDLCQGLEKQIPDMMQDYENFTASGQLKVINSAQFFRSCLIAKKIEHNLVQPQSKGL